MAKKSNITTAIENKSRVGGNNCEGVLGSNELVGVFAEFWKGNAGALHVIGANELVDYCSLNDDLDSRQIQAFKQGLAAFPSFFEACFAEKYQKELTAQNDTTKI